MAILELLSTESKPSISEMSELLLRQPAGLGLRLFVNSALVLLAVADIQVLARSTTSPGMS